MQVTREEARVHLGLQTQCQWNERAIARPPPALLSLYSIITLTTHQLLRKESTIIRVTAWYARIRPTFADAIALVRRHLWAYMHFSTSQHETDMIKIPPVLFDRFMDVVCYAA